MYQHSNTANLGYYPQSNFVPPTRYANTTPVNPCQQERENRTKIMIGVKQMDGYGTACRQPESCQGRILYVWRVHSGNGGAAIVPLTAAVRLFDSGLLGLMV